MKERGTVPQPLDAESPSRRDAIPSHPEEMKASFNLRIGDRISLEGSARMTPAGVVTGGIALSAVLVALGFLVWAGRKRGERAGA